MLGRRMPWFVYPRRYDLRQFADNLVRPADCLSLLASMDRDQVLRLLLPLWGVAFVAGFIMAYQVGKGPVGRIAVLGFWWWVGWHFLAR